MQGVVMRARVRLRGMTLMELIVVIVLLGILGVSFGVFIVPALTAYNALAQRATLVDAAESALRRMARDVRIAVPNSVRITIAGSGFTLEMVPTVDGGRYCATGLANCTAASELLDPAALDDNFEILGFFQDSTFTSAAAGTTTAYRLVVGNADTGIYSASGSSAVISPDPTTITLTTVSSRHHVALGATHQFCTSADCSPRQRVFVVRNADAPVRYVCDPSAQTLTRHAGYNFSGGPSGSGNLVASGVTDCGVAAMSSTTQVQDTGIVVMRLGLTGASGEVVTLMHQAQIDNTQ
jgi:MSHA biogenesis protein MshO